MAVSPPEICPQCGSEVPRQARSCPECGADEKTGWSERAQAQRLDLPEDAEEFDYEEFVEEEFGDKTESPVRPKNVGWFWWVVGVLLLVATAIYFMMGG